MSISRRGVVFTLWFSGMAGLILTGVYLTDLQPTSPRQADPYTGQLYKTSRVRSFAASATSATFYVTWEQYRVYCSLLLASIGIAAVGFFLNERWGRVVNYTLRGGLSLRDFTAESKERDVKPPFGRT